MCVCVCVCVCVLGKKALADGATRAVDMRISANLFDEVLVTSSGTTADFETYDFDSYTGSITITGVFSAPGESLAISEVRPGLAARDPPKRVP